MRKLQAVTILALVAFGATMAFSKWEYTFHRSGQPTDRLEFKIEAEPAILTGFHKRDDLPRGYVRYLTASGVREEGIICEVPWILNHHDVNFAGVKPMNNAFAVVIGFNHDGARDYAHMTEKFAGRRVAVVVNHKMVAILRINGADYTGKVTVEGNFPKEVAEALVRTLYAEE